MIKTIKNLEIQGRHDKGILLDLYYPEKVQAKEVVVFCHGYKGYKDWGAWHLVAERFAKENIFFIKMNFSHNGGTREQPIDFPDLEAFGQNNFIKELDDLESVLDWVSDYELTRSLVKLRKINLIGHSRGGGIVVLKSAEDERVARVLSWAGVSDFGARFPKGDQLRAWEKNGVAYIHNSRTKQQMPHYYQFYKTFKENEGRLTIRKAVSALRIPYLILHGTKDETVELPEAKALHSWNSAAEFHVIEGANHTFGSSQPWKEASMPKHLSLVVEKSLEFLGS